MYYQGRTPDLKPAEEPVSAPARCPVCGAPDVKTTSKVITAETYWRCESCGEVWNVQRRRRATTR
jgi:uncharacterized Zn finger protein